MAINATFSTKAVASVPASRKWAISIPAGFPIWVSIDSNAAGGVTKNALSALLQPGVHVYQSNVVDTFLSVWSTDPSADVTPVSIAFIDSGAGA